MNPVTADVIAGDGGNGHGLTGRRHPVKILREADRGEKIIGNRSGQHLSDDH
ncbi:MAG: hypothetical protein WAO02_09855 [Verrucomicrobiia bacterium]